jgi:type IV pilus assembly protein PilV
MLSFRSSHASPLQSQRGFSMIEVLVTMLIVTLALLGTAGLQAYSMRLNQGAQFRTQAVFLAADLAERMEANPAGAIPGGVSPTGGYATSWDYTTSGAYDQSSLSTACATGTCSALDLANFDKSQWQNAVAATLPQVSWVVCVDANGDGVCDTSPPTTDPTTYTITISWVDRRSDTGNQAAVAGGSTQQKLETTGADASGTGERFFYKSTRTVSATANIN